MYGESGKIGSTMQRERRGVGREGGGGREENSYTVTKHSKFDGNHLKNHSQRCKVSVPKKSFKDAV